MNIYGHILRLAGWKVDFTVPYHKKCVICVAPHTSNWDFVLGLLAYKSLGRKASFLMKSFWFFFPLGLLMRKLGGIPVKRSKSSSLTAQLIEDFKTADTLNLAITPEGTRSATSLWRTGFLRIAQGAHVPIVLGVTDFKNKEIIIHDEFYPSGDIDKDMTRIKEYFEHYRSAAKYPEKFCTD